MRCALALCLGLSACGFHPLYAPGGSAQEAALAGIFVNIIPNRDGQLLREALQARLEGAGATTKRYELAVAYADASEAISILPNNFSTRTRVTGSATWLLKATAAPNVALAHGTVRSLDGYDVVNNQFLYGQFQTEAIQRRQAEQLAGQIAEQLAAYFRAHPDRT